MITIIIIILFAEIQANLLYLVMRTICMIEMRAECMMALVNAVYSKLMRCMLQSTNNASFSG